LTINARTPPFADAESQAWQLSSVFTTAFLYDLTLINCTFAAALYAFSSNRLKETVLLTMFIDDIIKISYLPGVPATF
jgi:hypothetical protein